MLLFYTSPFPTYVIDARNYTFIYSVSINIVQWLVIFYAFFLISRATASALPQAATLW